MRFCFLVTVWMVLAPIPGRAASLAPGGGLDKSAERWLRGVRLLILPEEEALYRDLRDPRDRKEFERIFWARRDPNPASPASELEQAVMQARKRADELFAVPGERGSETGCGQVLALLGEPFEREGRELRIRFNSLPPMREGPLEPETWTYRSRPGDPASFTGGELRIAFDAACRFAEGGRVLEELRRVAASLISRPEIEYRKTAEGRLVPLEDLLRSAGGRPLIDSARADFPMEVEPRLLLRTQGGQAYAAGLVRADLRGLDSAPTGGASVLVAVSTVDASGATGTVSERRVRPAVVEGGATVVSWGLPLRSGHQALRVALQVGDKAAVAPVSVEVPDFESPGLKLSSLLVYPEVDRTAPADPQGPYSAFTVGPLRLEPRFGNVFTVADALQVVCVLYGGQTDPSTGKAALRARFSFLRDGRPVARGQDQAFDTPMAVASVGPVPLSGFAAGRYVVRVDAQDQVAGQAQTQEVTFEIKE